MTSTAAPAATNLSKILQRRTYWIAVLAWAVASWFLGDIISKDMKFRINDLSTIPGAGMVMRDVEGAYFHVNYLGQAREVFPELTQNYAARCLDCVLVTGEKLAETSEFCAAGVKSSLPAVEFQVPCRSWAVIDDGNKVVAVTLFLLPLLLWPILRATLRVFQGKKPEVYQ